ncbi:MAG: antitoxin [Sedimenticola sp.]
MVEGPKPKNADGYYPDVTEACERTLLTLLGAFGGLKTTLRLVGGLVPRYLTPEAPPDVPAHAGTSDVDVVLNLQIIAEGEGYATLADQLKARGFERLKVAEEKVSSWQWKRQVGEHMSVVTEFLHDAGDNQPGRVMSIDGERVSALSVKYAGIAHEWYEEREISAELLDDKGISTDTIRFADVPAFVILKALALADRHENKDAADLIHVLRYAGTIEEVAEQFVQRELSETHPGAVEAGLDALRRCFCDDEHGEGYEKLGSVGYALFHDTGDGDDRVRAQRDAAGLVQALLDRINERLEAA